MNEEERINAHAERAGFDVGVYRKFNVKRVDGSSDIGGKHHFCAYFVLDWQHDPFTIPAARAYADACESRYPALASDLRALAAKAERRAQCNADHGSACEGHGCPVHGGDE
jgi:hypothetical protein